MTIKKNKKSGFFTIFLAIAFIVCSFSFNVVHASEVKKSGHHSHHTKQTNQIGHVSEHHLLTQPDAVGFVVALPVIIGNKKVQLLEPKINDSSIEIINNQGAPPLFEPLRDGQINTKVW